MNNQDIILDDSLSIMLHEFVTQLTIPTTPSDELEIEQRKIIATIYKIADKKKQGENINNDIAILKNMLKIFTQANKIECNQEIQEEIVHLWTIIIVTLSVIVIYGVTLYILQSDKERKYNLKKFLVPHAIGLIILLLAGGVYWIGKNMPF